MKRLLILLILFAVVSLFAEYKIIQRAEDGRYYLDEETVILLANYIKRLEELNQNYRAQIANLEQQVQVLRDMLELEKAEKKALAEEVQRLKTELDKQKRVAWIVVGAITIGTLVLLFVR